jgi:hypothetical protein
MNPDEAMKFTFVAGNYYNGAISELVKRLDYVRRQLEVIEGMPASKLTAHRAREKRRMIGKFEVAIRTRLSWHAAELAWAAEAGFPIAEEFEPRKRTIKTGDTHVS